MLMSIRYVSTFYACTVEKVDSVGYTIEFVEYNSAYARLYDQFGAIQAW